MRVTPSPDGSCELFKSLIKEVWAAGDEEQYDWILEYLMHIFARPGERVRTSICIRGDGREGKSFVFKLLGKILGDMMLRVSDPNQVIGQFNKLLCGKLLCVLEEAAFVGDKKLFDRLKDLVTSETVPHQSEGLSVVRFFGTVERAELREHRAHLIWFSCCCLKCCRRRCSMVLRLISSRRCRMRGPLPK